MSKESHHHLHKPKHNHLPDTSGGVLVNIDVKSQEAKLYLSGKNGHGLKPKRIRNMCGNCPVNKLKNHEGIQCEGVIMANGKGETVVTDTEGHTMDMWYVLLKRGGAYCIK